MFAKLNSFLKDIIIASRIAYIFYPFKNWFLFLANLASLTHWVQQNKKYPRNNDFFIWQRNYAKRMSGLEFVLKTYQLDTTPTLYCEFGVASGLSFEWWLQHANHAASIFWGFDTFEGLPEDWGLFYKKGAMSHEIKTIADTRHKMLLYTIKTCKCIK